MEYCGQWRAEFSAVAGEYSPPTISHRVSHISKSCLCLRAVYVSNDCPSSIRMISQAGGKRALDVSVHDRNVLT